MRTFVRRRPPDRAAGALVLELIARELRGGATVVGALERVAATGEDDLGLAGVVDRIHHGAAVGDELDRWCANLAPDDAPLVRAVLRLGVSTGAALADALDRAAATIRERGELAAELRSLSAQSQASATMIAVAPVGFLIVLGFADPSGLSLLVTTRVGLACLLSGLALDVGGFWWMRRLVDRVAA